jgi:hypothetical protein
MQNTWNYTLVVKNGSKWGSPILLKYILLKISRIQWEFETRVGFFSPIQLTSRGRKKSILILVTLAISPYFVAHIIISFPTFETMYPTSTHSALSENRVPPKPFVNHHVSYSNNPNSGYSLVSDTPHSSRTTCPSEIAAQRRVILSPSSWNFSGTVTRWEWSNGYNEGPEIGRGVKFGWLVNSSYQASPLNGQHEQVQ